jgi:hypothetical protein
MSSFVRPIVHGLAWAVVPVFIIGMGSKIWMEYQLGLATYLNDIMLLMGFGAFALVGSLLVAKRPGNPVSWIIVSIGLMTGLFPAAETYAAYVMTIRGRPDLLAIFGAWANNLYWVPLLALALIYLPLLFPDGRLPSSRWLPVAVIAGITVAGFVGIGAISETLYGQDIDYQIDNPIGITGMPPVEEHPIFPVLTLGALTGVLGAVAAVVARFQKASDVERQQLKWFLFAAAFIPTFFIVDQLQFIGDLLFGLVLIGLPASIGIAILRYRLWDIDLIIHRTLVYSILTAALALVYFGSVVVLQGFIGRMTGENDSTAAIVVSTLAIAALFTPLRGRIQAFIDQRFYRRKYDAEHTLQTFAASLRDEVDLEQLSDQLLGVVQETMQPERVSLWLKPEGEVKPHEL